MTAYDLIARLQALNRDEKDDIENSILAIRAFHDTYRRACKDSDEAFRSVSGATARVDITALKIVATVEQLSTCASLEEYVIKAEAFFRKLRILT
jgi:hypothetical protein